MPEQEGERRLRGWKLSGTDKWWPAMFGPPPWDAPNGWEPVYEPAPVRTGRDERDA